MLNRTTHQVFIAIALMSLAGCAVLQPATPEEIVARRAQARVDALLAWDLERAISFSTPGYREIYDTGDLASSYLGARRWTAASVDAVTCGPERCRVKIMIEYRMVRPNLENRRPIDETWILVDGQWYHATRR